MCARVRVGSMDMVAISAVGTRTAKRKPAALRVFTVSRIITICPFGCAIGAARSGLPSPLGTNERDGETPSLPILENTSMGRSASHRLLQILVDLVEESIGGQPLLIGADEEREILCHETGFNGIDAHLLQR